MENNKDYKIENIKLSKTKNVRDLGKIPVQYGRIKKHKLLRGSCLDQLTQRDVDILIDRYKLSTIIDLRTYRETEESPDVKISNVEYIHIPIFDKRAPGITHEKGGERGSQGRTGLANMYKEILSGEHLERIAEIIRTIVKLPRDGYSVLFHCTEGKDRTGIVTAIILMILGANKHTIMEDYLYTNKVNEKKANKYYWQTRIFKHDKEKAERIRNAYLAKPEYIQAVFYAIQEDWYGVDNFIKYGLKLSEDEIEDFRDKVTY
ncbi:MAG: tyrosine-protein phosphatase [Clostridia bacterium]|nr:tyrosine-protein phosphatase [Clostridia bacterium]